MASAPGHRATPSFVLTSQIVLLRVTLHRTYVRHLALPCKTAVPIGRIRAAVVVKPTFKGVWLTAAHCAPRLRPATQPGQAPRPHQGCDDPRGCQERAR